MRDSDAGADDRYRRLTEVSVREVAVEGPRSTPATVHQSACGSEVGHGYAPIGVPAEDHWGEVP